MLFLAALNVADWTKLILGFQWTCVEALNGRLMRVSGKAPGSDMETAFQSRTQEMVAVVVILMKMSQALNRNLFQHLNLESTVLGFRFGLLRNYCAAWK